MLWIFFNINYNSKKFKRKTLITYGFEKWFENLYQLKKFITIKIWEDKIRTEFIF